MSNCSTSSGPVEATDWNWKPSATRATNSRASISQRPRSSGCFMRCPAQPAQPAKAIRPVSAAQWRVAHHALPTISITPAMKFLGATTARERGSPLRQKEHGGPRALPQRPCRTGAKTRIPLGIQGQPARAPGSCNAPGCATFLPAAPASPCQPHAGPGRVASSFLNSEFTCGTDRALRRLASRCRQLASTASKAARPPAARNVWRKIIGPSPSRPALAGCPPEDCPLE